MRTPRGPPAVFARGFLCALTARYSNGRDACHDPHQLFA